MLSGFLSAALAQEQRTSTSTVQHAAAYRYSIELLDNVQLDCDTWDDAAGTGTIRQLLLLAAETLPENAHDKKTG